MFSSGDRGAADTKTIDRLVLHSLALQPDQPGIGNRPLRSAVAPVIALNLRIRMRWRFPIYSNLFAPTDDWHVSALIRIRTCMYHRMYHLYIRQISIWTEYLGKSSK